MNRQYSSNKSVNLISWEDELSDSLMPKSNSLVEMFDPILIHCDSSDDVKGEIKDIINSSEDIFAPQIISKNGFEKQDNYDIFTDEFQDKSKRSSIYPSLDSFKHFYIDDRHSIFNENGSSSLSNSYDNDLRPSIFKDIIFENSDKTLFHEGYADNNMDSFMHIVSNFHTQAMDIKNDVKMHFIFNQILTSFENKNKNSERMDNRRCTVMVTIDDSCNANVKSQFCAEYDVYTTSERDIIIEIIHKYNISVEFTCLYLRINGQSEYLTQGEFPIKLYSYIFDCIRTHSPAKLILEYLDMNCPQYEQAIIIENPSKFIYNILEKKYHSLSRSSLENSFHDLNSYRNMVVQTLREYKTRNMDIASISASVGVFKDKCRAICILCGNIYNAGVAENFIVLDSVVENLITVYNSNTDFGTTVKQVKYLIEVLNSLTNFMVDLIHKISVFCNSNFTIRTEQLASAGMYRSLSGCQSIRKYRSVFSIKLGSICRISNEITQYNSFILKICLRVGSRDLSDYLVSRKGRISDTKRSKPVNLKNIHPDFDQCITFNQTLKFDNVIMSWLPLDTSIFVSLIGQKIAVNGDVNYVMKDQLAWAEIPLFDSKCVLKQGGMIIGLFFGQRDSNNWGVGFNMHQSCMTLEIELPIFHVPIKYEFPTQKSEIVDVSAKEAIEISRDYVDAIVTKVWTQAYKSFSSTNAENYLDEASFLWVNRFGLMHRSTWYLAVCLALAQSPPPLSKIVSTRFKESYMTIDETNIRDLLPEYLELCTNIPQSDEENSSSGSGSKNSCIIELIHMLGPMMPLRQVRRWAIAKLSAAGSEACLLQIPLLVEILKYDLNIGNSGLEEMLLDFSYKNINFATSLFWNLKSIAPQDITGYKVTLLLSALQVVVNGAVKEMWNHQLTMVEYLEKTASAVKTFKGSVSDRKNVMFKNLEELYDKLYDLSCSKDKHNLSSYRIPYFPGMELMKLEIKDCSYFNSFTLPLRVVFRGLDNENVELMFKKGDDLRQDILVLQLLKLMDNIWISEGLDLCPVHYRVMSTGINCGLIELVPDCVTLRKIQESKGGIAAPLTTNNVIAEWLRSQNATKSSYLQSVLNFLLTSVFSCVATFLLGIGDRHNDNIMIQTSGRLFHIDFAKILGDAQTFAGIKRDRVPFVLTQDMVYVLDDLELNNDDPRTGMQYFIDKCCEAYNIIRRHWCSLIALLTIGARSEVPGVNSSTIEFVINRMKLNMSDTEASEYFTDLIKKCLSSISTPMNFVIHNLAQMKYASNNEGSLFSFTPKSYSNEARILEITVKSVRKIRQPQKHYIYKMIVVRENIRKSHSDYHLVGNTSSNIYRRFDHFIELAQNLAQEFPLSILPKIANQICHSGAPSSLSTAEAKRILLQHFLSSILSLEDEISQCDIVHTFFHSLLSDEQIQDEETMTLTQSLNKSYRLKQPEIQLKIRFDSKLEIFVKHARNLSYNRMVDMPNAYVKTYLHPDPGYSTKRKTSIVPRSSTPSFNDILSYEQSEIQNCHYLEVSVWHHETLKENICLGSVYLPINDRQKLQQMCNNEKWFKLGVTTDFTDYNHQPDSNNFSIKYC